MARGAGRARALVACAFAALAMCLGNADAQTRRTASQAERERRVETARAERLRMEANAARREVRQLDARLAAANQRRQEAEIAAIEAQARLDALRAQIDTDTVRRRNAQSALESALIAAAFAERRVEPRATRAGIFARAAAPSFARVERASAASIAQARQLEIAIAQEQITLAEAQQALETERTEIAGLIAQRRAAQSQLTREASAADRRARQLAAEARTLRELAQRVQQATPRAAASTTPAPSGPSAIPAAWMAPAEGRITRNYGARDADGLPSQGVMVRTASGARVIAPANAEIAYAGVFRSYGQVLILNVDGGYALVLTGLETIQARVGQTVSAGQTIGQMPSSDTAAPDLYVEVRRSGQPVDPGRWLSARLAGGSNVRAG